MTLAADDPRHGTYGAYSNHKCRCDACRAANTRATRDSRERRKYRLAADPTLAPHGVWTTYQNWVCRCELCVDAYRQKERRNYRRRLDGALGSSGAPVRNADRDAAIRGMRREGFSVAMLAAMFDISPSRVSRITKVSS